MTFVSFLIAGFVLPVVLGLVRQLSTRVISLGLAAFAAGFFAVLLSWLPQVREGDHVEFTAVWSQLSQLDIAFVIDPLALMFLLVITGVGAVVLLYSSHYFEDSATNRTVVVLIALFMTAMSGLVAADNIVLLFIFWELTTVISFLLIGSKHEDEEARKSALQALIVTGGGGMLLLAGLVTLGFHTDEWTVSGLATHSELTGPLVAAATVLIALGAFTKSAQFPFHFWLPNAMVAPSPVSSFLHSATMVKAGVFILMKMTPVLGEQGGGLWFWLLVVPGGITMILGAVEAARHDDIKRILAMTTVSGLGTLVFLIGIGTPTALKAAVIFFIAHAVYKSGLFLAAGSIEHAIGSRSLAAATGLGRVLPLTTIGVVVAAVSMAGFPPTIGYVAKEVIFDSTEHSPLIAYVLMAAVWIGLVALVYASVRLCLPLVRTGFVFSRQQHESLSELIPVLLPALGGVLLGTVIGATWEFGARAVALQLSSAEAIAQPVLWPGPNLAFGLSVSVLAAGTAAAVAMGWRRMPATSRLSTVDLLGTVFDQGLAGLNTGGRTLTRVLQNGSLNWYVTVVITVAVILLGVSLQWLNPLHVYDFGDSAILEWVLAIVVGLSAYIGATTRSGFTAVASLGVVGFGVAIIFAIFNAPDLAITQLLVETLLVILFLFVLMRLPLRSSRLRISSRIRNMVVATAGGVAMGLVAWTAGGVQSDELVGRFYSEQSLPAAEGRNVVNTILVDFRALDTLGEIVVLATATVGFVALLRARRARNSDD